jgi:hypothetical protein
LDVRGGNKHILGERPSAVNANLGHCATKQLLAAQTEEATAAGDVDVGDYLLPEREVFDARPDFCNGARELMAQCQWKVGGGKVSFGDVKVGATNTSPPHFEDYFSIAWAWNVNLIESKITRGMKSHGFHGGHQRVLAVKKPAGAFVFETRVS